MIQQQQRSIYRQVSNRLNQKYQDSFCFFREKQINQLVYDIGSRDTILYEDLTILDDDSQYLRRMYSTKTVSGKNEIQQRIHMVSKFYIQYNMLTFEVPFMLITNTKQLYLRRQKKMKQLKRQSQQFQQQQQYEGNVNSNRQQQQFKNQQQKLKKIKDFNVNNDLQIQQEKQKQNDEDYLLELQLGLSQLMIDDQSSYLDGEQQLQMDQQVYDIFDCGKNLNIQQKLTFSNSLQQQDIEQQPYEQFSLSISPQNNIDHLICDFMQIDIDHAIQYYRQLIKTNQKSTLISQLLQQEIKLSHKNSSKYDKHSQKYDKNSSKYDKNSSKYDKNSSKLSYLNLNQKQQQYLTNYLTQKTISTNDDRTVNDGVIDKVTKGFFKNNKNIQITLNNINRKYYHNNNNNKQLQYPPIPINYASTPHLPPNSKPISIPKPQPQPNSTLIEKYLQKYKHLPQSTTSIQNQQQQDYLIQQQKQQRNKIRQKAQKLLLKIKTQSTINF